MTLLDFNELREGQQVGIQTTDRGVVSGTAVPSSAGGVSIGFIDAGAGNQSFNGDGSSGANRLSTITTIKRTGITSATIVYDFLPAGVTTGALVFFVLAGDNVGSVSIQNDGDELAIVEAGTEPTAPRQVPYPVLVFDGTNWQCVADDFHGT